MQPASTVALASGCGHSDNNNIPLPPPPDLRARKATHMYRTDPKPLDPKARDVEAALRRIGEPIMEAQARELALLEGVDGHAADCAKAVFVRCNCCHCGVNDDRFVDCLC